jgi:hypothetical protein
MVPVNPATYFYAGVFDGHNGDAVADYVAQHLDRHLDGVWYIALPHLRNCAQCIALKI